MFPSLASKLFSFKSWVDLNLFSLAFLQFTPGLLLPGYLVLYLCILLVDFVIFYSGLLYVLIMYNFGKYVGKVG